MPQITKIAAGVVALSGLLLATAALYGDGYLVNAVTVTAKRGRIAAGTEDHRFFPGRTIPANASRPWEKHPLYNTLPLSERTQKALDDTESLAYLVIKDGQLLQERYFRDHGPDRISNSFSMSKPVVGMLLAFAVAEGKIGSLEDPVGKYLDGYDQGAAARLKIVDLIRMTSGMTWDDPEVYNAPFSRTARLYYDDNLSRFIGPMEIGTEPGVRFHYNSANTVLAARIVRNATGKSVSAYLAETLWQPLGMEHDANWMLDHADGEEKAYCCLSATARDFARLGQFVLQDGAWSGRQLLPRDFFRAALQPSSPNYGYGFRMDHQHEPAFSMFRGINGQLIIMLPKYNTVIVKLGRKALPDDPSTPLVRAPETYALVDEVVKSIRALPPSRQDRISPQ
jgi:CubicO group peptidase (beta-lactamase class C family)